MYKPGGCRLGPNGPKPIKTRDHASVVIFFSVSNSSKLLIFYALSDENDKI